ncbi:hypothetical protein KC640_01725, partial [Candidatus Dojkabacteria bacterium]|nr:hypothetical protein [Candidatus Dojkabacteria bacterium]
QSGKQERSDLYVFASDLVKFLFPGGTDTRSTTTSYNLWRMQSEFFNRIDGSSATDGDMVTEFLGRLAQMRMDNRFNIEEVELVTTQDWPVAQSFQEYWQAGGRVDGRGNLNSEQRKAISDYLGSQTANNQNYSDAEFLVNRDQALRLAMIGIEIIDPQGADDTSSPFASGKTKSGRLNTLQYFYDKGGDLGRVLSRYFPVVLGDGESPAGAFRDWCGFLQQQGGAVDAGFFGAGDYPNSQQLAGQFENR